MIIKPCYNIHDISAMPEEKKLRNFFRVIQYDFQVLGRNATSGNASLSRNSKYCGCCYRDDIDFISKKGRKFDLLKDGIVILSGKIDQPELAKKLYTAL